MAVRIGELLLKEKRITPEQLQQALNHQKANGGKLGYNLVKMGFVKDEEITALLSKQYGVPSINLTQFEIDPAVIKLIPADTAPEVSDRPAEPRRRDADDRDDGSDQRLRDGRHQVHDRLQRRAGRGVRDGGDRRDSAVLPDGGKAATTVSDAAGPERARSRDARVSKSCRRSTRPATSRFSTSCEEISAETLAKQGEEAPVVRLVNVRADVGDPEGRERHPHRAVREGAAGPLPHRRDSLQHHEPADEVPRRDRVAHQDHGEARHRREAPAAGRPHQDPLQRERHARRRSTSACRACRRCSARRSSCVSSTRTS